MKIYISMNALPWESFSVSVPNPNQAEQNMQVTAASDAVRAGFLPIFWSADDAQKVFPDCGVQEAEVPDDWNPWRNAQQPAAE